MKKIFSFAIALFLLVSLSACGAKGPNGKFLAFKVTEGKGDVIWAEVTYRDGELVDVVIEHRQSNKIVDEEGKVKIAWKATKHTQGHKYVLGSGTPWTDEVKALEDFIVENGVEAVTTFEDGSKIKTDVVTGVTIGIGDYLEVVQAAMENAEAGKYVAFEVVEDKGDVVWAELTYNGNKLQEVLINQVQSTKTVDEEGKVTIAWNDDKHTLGENYVLGSGNTWTSEVVLLQDYILANGIEDINLTDDAGHTDTVSGVTIKIGTFLDVVEKAMSYNR